MAVQIQLRRDTASNWTSANPTLAAGEFAIETDTDKYKIGDGSTAWTSLGYSSLPSGTAPLASPTFTGTVTIPDLIVNGTTSTINSTTLTVDDKNIELGSVASPSDATADGGGITLKGASDKTITWVNATDTWDFNQGITVTGTATATAFAGPLTGNASTATALATGRTIGGVSFDGTANINLPGVNASGTQDTSGNATTATTAGTVTTAAQTAITSVGTLSALAVTGAVTAGSLVAPLAVNTPTASYTLVIGDAGKLIEMDVGSTNTLTIPTNTVDFDVGTQIMVIQKGSGATTIAGAGSVAIYSKDSNKVIDGQYATVTLVKRADTGDGQWHLIGALTS
ncbi:uncharacterized protein METZ01_LOCUS205524 [marine metagenome]|uniref:Major tropism determinant N-terminal domain-containing protein n=1 Tax=marine metagenome TaxID=408172 RepID=A0A382EPK9_9ZZZZ